MCHKTLFTHHGLLEIFRFWDENDYENKIFSILSIAHPWTSIILAGKCDIRHDSTLSFNGNVVVAETSYQHNSANFSGESNVQWSFKSGYLFFWEYTKKLQVKSRTHSSSRPRI